MPARPPEKKPRARSWPAVLVIVLLVGWVFSLSIRGEFLLWDDDINLTGNPHLQNGLTAESARWMFTDAGYMRRYIPFAWLGWAVEREVTGLTALSAHAGNMMLHAINAVLVFFLARRLVPRRDDDDPAFARNVAAVAALVWALHPLRVEVVAWASGRMYAQGACFALLGVLAYLRAADGPRRAGWLAVSLAALAIAILTYPVFVPVVGVLPLLDLYVLRRFETGVPLWGGVRNRAVWLEKLPFLALAAVIALVTIAARAKAQGIWAPPPTLEQFPLFDRVAQAGYVWAYYVWRPLWPSGFAPVYTALVEFDSRGFVFLASIALVLGVSGFLFWRRARLPGVWALWVAHLLLIAPMLGLAEHPHYTNDRYAYLQGVVGVVALAWVVRAGGTVALRLATAAAIALGVLSNAQTKMWRSSETLFRGLYAHVGPTEYRSDIAMRLGEVLRAQGRLAEATSFFEESLKILPQVTRAAVSHTGLGRIAWTQNRLQDAADRFVTATRMDPNFAPAHRGLGELLIGVGRWAEAVPPLERAVALNGDDAEARDWLGGALVQVRRPAEAVAQFEASLRLRPRRLDTICNLVVALADAGRHDEAQTLGRDVAEKAARAAQAHFALGHALRAAGKRAEAITAYAKALELQPDHAAAREALAALRAQ
ncbi:MAG: tetratricopeptide repeat protein [Opitutaceae bacterium]|nr:tetratricopeptide repeat protein [Opitutaceae bacterium]